MHMKISRRAFLGTLLGATTLAVTACAQSSQNQNSSASSSSSSSAESSTSSSSSDEQRIVALNTGQLDNLLLLGITPVASPLQKTLT